MVIRFNSLWTRCSPVWCALFLVAFTAGGVAGSDPTSFFEDPRLDVRSRVILEGQNSDPEPAGHFVLEGSVDPAAIHALGGQVITRAGSVTTVLAPLDRVRDLLSMDGLRGLSLASRVAPFSDVSVPETEADFLWNSNDQIPPTYMGLTGKSVVVGIVDSGIDLTHPDFQDASGQTRIKVLWDQTWAGSPPAGFGYGTEYSASAINSGAASECRDTEGHGTHVAGIAAGNGRGTGEGEPAYQYVGVAPEADLVVVKTRFTDAGIIDAVNYVFQKAQQLGKPAVVNLSVGTQRGGHDGSHTLDLAVSALTGPGRLVTAAVGNFGGEAIHASIDIGNGQSADVPFVLPAYTPTTHLPESVFLQGWHDPTASFRVKLRSPGGIESGWVSPGATSGSVEIVDGTYRIDNGLSTNSKGGKLVAVSVWRGSTTGIHPAAGTWTITVDRESGTSSGELHFWVADWNLESGNTSPAFSSPDPTMTVASPATADGVIATGAYATKRRWNNAAGGISSFGSMTLGALAEFSAMGPRRDGAARPDIVAPGYGVAASLSEGCPSSAWDQVPDRVHNVRAGTSQANAHTTGALALLLEEDPGLTPSEAKGILMDRARTDEFTGPAGSLPSPGYGYGKLSLLPAGSTAVIDDIIGDRVPPVAFGFRVPYPNPSRSATTFQFNLSLQELTDPLDPPRVEVFDVAGRLMRTLKGRSQPGEQVITWDGMTESGRVVPEGVYFAHLVVGEVAAVRKLIRLGQ